MFRANKQFDSSCAPYQIAVTSLYQRECSALLSERASLIRPQGRLNNKVGGTVLRKTISLTQTHEVLYLNIHTCHNLVRVITYISCLNCSVQVGY